MYSGKEGKLVSEELFETLVKSYEEIHKDEDGFIKSDTIGIEELKKLFVKGAVSIRVFRGYNGDRNVIVFVPVDTDGNKLPLVEGDPTTFSTETTSSRGIQTDTPHCPTQCG